MDGATTLRMIGVSPPRRAPVRSAGQAAPPERADGPIPPAWSPSPARRRLRMGATKIMAGAVTGSSVGA